MTEQVAYFTNLARDVTALLAIADCLELMGESRVACLLRVVTMSVEQSFGDIRHEFGRVTRLNLNRKPAAPPLTPDSDPLTA